MLILIFCTMLNKKDIEVLRGMFQEQEVKFDKKLDERFTQQEVKIDQHFAQQEVKIDQRFAQQEIKIDEHFAQQEVKIDQRFAEQERNNNQKLEDQQMNLEDKLRSCIKASETTMMRKMEELKEEILDGISEIVGNEILPQIDEHTREIGLIKHMLKLA